MRVPTAANGRRHNPLVGPGEEPPFRELHEHEVEHDHPDQSQEERGRKWHKTEHPIEWRVRQPDANGDDAERRQGESERRAAAKERNTTSANGENDECLCCDGLDEPA